MSLTPRKIVDRAIAEHQPVAIRVDFSGGRDSLAIMHWMMTNVPGPTVLVGFAPEDWAARDRFAASLTHQEPAR